MDSLDTAMERAETWASRQISSRRTNDSGPSQTVSYDSRIARHPTQISRLASQRLQHVYTVGSTPGSRSVTKAEKAPLPAFGGGKSYPPLIPAEKEAYVVDFDGKFSGCWQYWHLLDTAYSENIY